MYHQCHHLTEQRRTQGTGKDLLDIFELHPCMEHLNNVLLSKLAVKEPHIAEECFHKDGNQGVLNECLTLIKG